jgi:hypothetical protein
MNDKLKGIEKTFSDTTDRKSEKLKMHLNSKAINYSKENSHHYERTVKVLLLLLPVSFD